MKVEQIQAVAHPVVTQEMQGFDDFADEQAELAANPPRIPATVRHRVLPVSHAPDRGFHPVHLGVLGDEFQLAELFYDGNDVASDLGS